MPFGPQLALFSGVIVLGAVAGAAIPLWAKATRLIAFMAFAAGVMFGAAFFHMLPEAYHGGGIEAFWLVPAGFVFLFLLERYVLVHACEEPPDCAEHVHSPAMGLSAFLGLAVHTLFDGVALGSGIVEGVGFSTFVAIAAHKIPSSLSLAAVLKSEGRTTKSILGYATLYGLMVPAGASGWFLLNALLPFERFSPLALAFSAGSFLYIAVSDLLPHINRHGKDRRLRNVVGLLLGLALMFVLSLFLEDHAH